MDVVPADLPYPPGPAQIPPDLTRATGAYRRHAYLAVLGLLLFGALYLAFASWLGYEAVHHLQLAGAPPTRRGGSPPAGHLVLAAVAGFLCLWLVKALWPRRATGGPAQRHELTAASEPTLFAFLYRLADEAGAPRPRHVYVTSAVNMSVAQDVSLLRLVFPGPKRLEIGLGLVNGLTLGEVKAVLAHELGHFAQRTTAVGRWVYVARQVAGQIVVVRDRFDRAILTLCASDPRIAWAGWGLRLIVWSVRSVVDSLFGWVLRAQRALGREMELQADKVAVALTGSDALIHGLYRLEAVDDAMDRAVAFAGEQRGRGRTLVDLFDAQSHFLARTRAILADPDHGHAPPLPADPATHRLFAARVAQPPRMWATHPPNDEREASAKQPYVAAPLDDRSAWLLFADPERLRREVTRDIFKEPTEDRLEPAEARAAIDALLDRASLDPAYRGAYLGREIALDARALDDLIDPAPLADVATALRELYPSALAEQLERARELDAEHAQLAGLARGVLEAPGGIIRFRGQDHRKRALPALQAAVTAEREQARAVVAAHDRRARSAHLAAAAAVGGGWDAYLRAMLRVHHFATHAVADVEDAAGALGNAVAVATADGHVSETEQRVVLAAALELHAALVAATPGQGDLELGDLRAAMAEHAFEPMKLPAPSAPTLGRWLGVVGSWIEGRIAPLARLRGASLDAILRGEEQVAHAFLTGSAIAPPPVATEIRRKYRVCPPADARPRQERLGPWDRFVTADGAVAGAARFAVAGGILGALAGVLARY